MTFLKPEKHSGGWQSRIAQALLLAAVQIQSQAQPVAPLVLNTSQQTINEKIEVLGAPFELKALPDQQKQLARIVFYRHPQQTVELGAVAVFVQDQLHTALIPGGYSALCLPAARLDIRIRQGQRTANATLDAQAAATQYITFTESAGLLAINAVAEQPALAALQDLRLQTHVLTRVRAAKPCEERVPTQTTPAETKPS